MSAQIRSLLFRIPALLVAVLMLHPARATGDERSGARTGRATKVKVAAIQCSSELGAVKENRAKLSLLVRQAAAEGAKIIVLPEAAITGYVSQDLRHNWHIRGRPLEAAFSGRDPSLSAETVPGPST